MAAASIAAAESSSDCIDERQRWSRERRNDLRCLARRWWQALQPLPHQIVQARRDRDLLIGLPQAASLDHRSRNLDREERVPARAGMKTLEQPRGRTHIEAGCQQQAELRRLE